MGAFPSSHDFAPLFRMLDDYTSHAARTLDLFPAPVQHNNAAAGASRHGVASFQPRFDVRELDGAYELRGELPGVEQKDLEVEFTDAQTLVIRGRTEREETTGQPDLAAAADTTDQVADVAEHAIDSDVASNHSSSSFVKATVEDDDEASASTPGRATPAESTTGQDESHAIQTQAVPTPAPQATAQQTPSRYWVSERSVGDFQRSFGFPSRVDREGVRASLRNGVLSILVPKAAAPASRRIQVE